MSERVSVRAVVTMMIELPVSDRWGGTVTADQVHKQAKESAIGILRSRRLVVDGMVNNGGIPEHPIQITIRDLQVRSIITTEER